MSKGIGNFFEIARHQHILSLEDVRLNELFEANAFVEVENLRSVSAVRERLIDMYFFVSRKENIWHILSITLVRLSESPVDDWLKVLPNCFSLVSQVRDPSHLLNFDALGRHLAPKRVVS